MADIKLIIFDCDGVMFDSKNANLHFYNRICEKFQRPLMDEDELEYVHMHHVFDSVGYLFRDLPGLLEEAHEYRKTLDYRRFIRYMTIEPDLVEFLDLITPACRTAISTNRTTTMATLLEQFGLGKYFGLVVTAMDVANPKPHPEALHRILGHFGLGVMDSLFIGDSPVDLDHAAALGMRMVAFKNPGLGAEYHVNRFMEILDLPMFGDFPGRREE